MTLDELIDAGIVAARQALKGPCLEDRTKTGCVCGHCLEARIAWVLTYATATAYSLPRADVTFEAVIAKLAS